CERARAHFRSVFSRDLGGRYGRPRPRSVTGLRGGELARRKGGNRRCRRRRIAIPSHPAGSDVMASVLVVDDDAGIRESAAMALQKVGHRTLQASDATTAQQLLRQHRVDVVVSDIYMPGENGLSLLESIVARHDPPHVILMTARGTIETTALAKRAGAFDYL